MSANTQVTEPPLDWPHYGIGFVAAIKRAFKKYATFTGRASRGEYWWFVLFYAVVIVVVYAILAVVVLSSSTAASTSGSTSATPAFGVGASLLSSLFGVFYLGTIVPYLAVAVRRLHDTGRSGWTVLFGLIPLVGGIIVLVFLAGETTPAAEQYGPPQSQYAAPGYGAPGAYGQSYPPA